MLIREIRADHYVIPLPTALSDSTHGTIEGFELVTARVRDADGVEGVGYTYTVGAGGGAVHSLIARDLAPRLTGREAERIALIDAGGVTFPEPDVTNCGGVTTFMKVCHLAEAYNLPVTSHGAHDITVHLLAAVPNRSYLEAHGFGLERFIAEPLRIDEGAAVAPDRPGHGVDFDWKALDRVRAG
jgi:L-alanine-DL-glutamate epimerase-like enolase superfamily enzyme